MAKKESLLKIATLSACLFALTGMQGRLGSLDARILAEHNRERSEFGLDALRWDDSLAEDAEEWADYLARTGRFEHSPNAPGEPLQGENLWAGTNGAWAPEDMVGLWLAERRNFRPGVFPNNSMSGRVSDVSHFTQVVWHDTRRVGCALREGEREEFLVCRYSSPGNIIGKRPLGPS